MDRPGLGPPGQVPALSTPERRLQSRDSGQHPDRHHAGMDERSTHPTLRWVILHMIEETARHIGHLDLLRQMADGVTGD